MTPELVRRPILSGGHAGDMNIVVIIENAHGDLSDHSLAGLIILAGAGKGDRGGIGFFINRVIGGEAVGKHHVVELPVVDAVHVDHGINGLDILNVVRGKIHPIDGAEQKLVKGRVGGNELNCGSVACFYLEHADHNRLVACVITDLELNAVITVFNLDVVDAHCAVCVRGGNFNAVDISLCG